MHHKYNKIATKMQNEYERIWEKHYWGDREIKEEDLNETEDDVDFAFTFMKKKLE